MRQGETERLIKHVEQLIDFGKAIPLQESSDEFVDLQRFAHWRGLCRQLIFSLGRHAAPWRRELSQDDSHVTARNIKLGTLEAIRDTLNMGWLTGVEDLVRADTFADLLEQADYLLSEGYHVAAGVLGRAVLEDHLRHSCAREGCMPSVPRPTLDAFKAELYKARHIDKLAMKNVEAMAAIGNSAAHSQAVDKSDVERLLREVRGFLAQKPRD